MCLQTDRQTDRQTDGRRLESLPISSPCEPSAQVSLKDERLGEDQPRVTSVIVVPNFDTKIINFRYRSVFVESKVQLQGEETARGSVSRK